MTGWFRLHRGWRDCEAFDQGVAFSEREAWLWLIEHAAFKAMARRNAKGERVQVGRGQLHTSLRSLGDAWTWGKNKVARFIEKLSDHEMAGTVAGQSGLVITICNYDKYQDAEDSRDTETGTVAGQSRDTQEEGKEGEENSPPIVPPGDRRGKHLLPEDWQLPTVAELTPQAKACAEQWTAASYAAQGEEFVNFWRGRGRMTKDWRLTWCGRVVAQHAKVMRDQKFGNDAPAPSAKPKAEPRPPELEEAYQRHLRGDLDLPGYMVIADKYRPPPAPAQPRRMNGSGPRDIGTIMGKMNIPAHLPEQRGDEQAEAVG